jgi:hypothetical protein
MYPIKFVNSFADGEPEFANGYRVDQNLTLPGKRRGDVGLVNFCL